MEYFTAPFSACGLGYTLGHAGTPRRSLSCAASARALARLAHGRGEPQAGGIARGHGAWSGRKAPRHAHRPAWRADAAGRPPGHELQRVLRAPARHARRRTETDPRYAVCAQAQLVGEPRRES